MDYYGDWTWGYALGDKKNTNDENKVPGTIFGWW